MAGKKQIDDAQFAKLLDHFNFSRRGYRKVRKGVKKRIARHMQELGCRNIDQYIAVISHNPHEEKTCKRNLTVSISRFFRDRRLWRVLRNDILPGLIAKADYINHQKIFKVWSCGCARGEEAYSFNILWKDLEEQGLLPKNRQPPEPKIWATDMNPEYLDMAKKGAYQYSSLKELSSDLIVKYFTKQPGKNRYFVDSKLKPGITFEQNNILEDPPPSENFSIIFLRNSILTYYRSPEKENTLIRITGSLKAGGVLIVGSHEKLPKGFGFMISSPFSPWIYIKQPFVTF